MAVYTEAISIDSVAICNQNLVNIGDFLSKSTDKYHVDSHDYGICQ